MGLFDRKRELRAETVEFEDSLLTAMLGAGAVTKEMALQVPTVSGGIDLIAGIIAGTPIKLYREIDGKAEEVPGDRRAFLLNDEPGDTLDANQFWRALIRDYYLGKGGYAYINWDRNTVRSIHYVDEAQVAVWKNEDPIFKEFALQVGGRRYHGHEFLKLLRNTKDGASGTPITVESCRLIEVAYQTLCFEGYLVKKGGNKKGFLKSEKSLAKEAMDTLKSSFARLYSNTSDNVVILNKGLDFIESSATSVEMQLNENKVTNAGEFAKIFHISPDIMSGRADDVSAVAKLAAIPLMSAIQCALNRDLLLEREKGTYYWAFDTKELLKGDMKSRFEAYKTALEANFMQPDEVRFAEDMEPLGLGWIRLGLQDVLYDPKSKTIYTPNTNQTAIMGEVQVDTSLQEGTVDGTIARDGGADDEKRANNYIQLKNGKMNGSRPSEAKTGDTKYAPSPQRNKKGIQLGAKRYARLCGTLGTLRPGLEAGQRTTIRDARYEYLVEADGYGGFSTLSVKKLK